MDWELLKDMLTSDFWTLGGTSSFFSNPDDAREFAEQRVIVPYDGITGAQSTALLEASQEAYNHAWWARGAGWAALSDAEVEQYGWTVSETEAAHLYWEIMLEEVKKTNDPWLISFFSGQAEISQETIDHVEGGVVRWDLFKESFEEQQRKIPWALIIGALALYMWRK